VYRHRHGQMLLKIRQCGCRG